MNLYKYGHIKSLNMNRYGKEKIEYNITLIPKPYENKVLLRTLHFILGNIPFLKMSNLSPICLYRSLQLIHKIVYFGTILLKSRKGTAPLPRR